MSLCVQTMCINYCCRRCSIISLCPTCCKFFFYHVQFIRHFCRELSAKLFQRNQVIVVTMQNEKDDRIALGSCHCRHEWTGTSTQTGSLVSGSGKPLNSVVSK